MKRRSILSRLMVMTMAAALVFGNGATTLTVHATDDGAYHGNGREGESGFSTGSISIGGGSSDSGSGSSGGGGSYSAPSGGGSSNDSGSSDSGSGSDGGSSYVAPSGDSGNSGNGGGGTATAPSGLATKGNTATIPGHETFRQVNKPADGRVAIYHCGIEQYTAQLTNADGKAAAYKSAGAYKDEATGKWYLNLVTADGVDTTGYTIGTWKGAVTYLPKLGMSGVMLNGTIMVDAEAAAAAETAAK